MHLDPKRRPHYGPGARKRFASVAEAEAWLVAEIARRTAPAGTPVSTIAQPLHAYLARWYADNLPNWPERTAQTYRYALRHWAAIGAVPVGQLTRETVRGAYADLQRATWQRTDKHGKPVGTPRPYSRTTVTQALSVLHQALGDLVPDVLATNPAALQRRQRSSTHLEPDLPVWSAEQANTFLEVAERVEPQLALAFRLILRLGLRVGEVADLRWDAIDLSRGIVAVERTAGLKPGTSGPPKTRRFRDLPGSDDLIARIRAHRRAYPSTLPHLFAPAGQRVSVAYLRRRWDHCARVAQVPPISPKDGRATCATVLLDAGWPLPRVSQLLGHRSVATTARYYARVIRRRDAELGQLGQAIEEAFGRAPDADAKAR